jgi:hypothetical protein
MESGSVLTAETLERLLEKHTPSNYMGSPDPTVLLDEIDLIQRYKDGAVELLPIIQQICNSTVKSGALRGLSGSTRALTASGELEIPGEEGAEDDAVAEVLAGETWNRVPVTSRVQVSYNLTTEANFSAVLQADRLADAVFERLPGLKRGKGLTARPRTAAFGAKVYKTVYHPKLVAPIGRIDRSVMVKSLRGSALPTINGASALPTISGVC